jgi:hypothetical protein
MVLSGQCRGRHQRPGDRAHGRRRPRPFDQWAWETARTTPSCARVRRRSLVVARPCDLRRRAGRAWYMVYHAYENGFHTLGRQTVLEPMAWTADGWFRATGDWPSRCPNRPARPCRTAWRGRTISRKRRWAGAGRSMPARPPMPRGRAWPTTLTLRAKGSGPQDGTVLTQLGRRPRLCDRGGG